MTPEQTVFVCRLRDELERGHDVTDEEAVRLLDMVDELRGEVEQLRAELERSRGCWNCQDREKHLAEMERKP